MKPFAFELEKLLNLRKFYEEGAKIELGRAVGVLAELEGRITALAAERVKAAAAQFMPGNGAIEIQQYMYYLVRLDNTKERLLKEAAIAEMKVEQAREAFLEASRERKALDSLKEKKQKEYHKMKLNEETKILDDRRYGIMA
jgi:flagellar FliJ protein